MGSQYYEYAGGPDGQTARTARTARTAWNNKLLLAKDIAFRVALLITFCVARSLNDLDVLRQEMSRVPREINLRDPWLVWCNPQNAPGFGLVSVTPTLPISQQ